MGTGPFPGVKYDRGVLLTTHPLLVQRSWKSRAIPLPTLWATTRPVTGTLLLIYYTYASTYLYSKVPGQKVYWTDYYLKTNAWGNNLRNYEHSRKIQYL